MERCPHGQHKLGEKTMKYVLKKITSISALNDWHGLGKVVAERLESGEAVEIQDPPKTLLDGGYLIESKKKGDK